MPVETIKIPDLGGSEDVEVIEILVSEGQEVKENDSLIVLESDKAAMEIPSPKAGVIKRISVKMGDEVSQGDDMVEMEFESAGGDEEQDSSAGDSGQKAPESDSSQEKAGEEPEKGGEKEPEPASGEPELETIKVPDLGGDTDVEVIELHVAAGDEIEAEDSLITLESDKAAMEIPSPKAGKVEELKLAVGDKVSAGSPILDLLVAASSASGEAPAKSGRASSTSAKEEKAEPAAEKPSGKAEQEQPQAASTQAQASQRPAAATSHEGQKPVGDEQPTDLSSVYAGPAVRKLARELGVDLTQVKGTGARDRVIKEDVQNFVKQRLDAPAAATGGAIAQVPDVDFSQFGEIEQQPMSKLHRLTAANMQRNWNLVPAVAQFNEADITDLEAFRAQQRKEGEKRGVKLTLLPFLLKACAQILKELPQFNVSLHSSGEYLIQKKYVHIGVAVATEAGLVVPVIRDVDKKSIWELGAEMAELSDKARQRRLSKDEMQGACFTISSLGAIGGTGFIPIVNAPEVAILGVSKTQVKPVYLNEQFVPRKMLPVTLTWDHRAVNGVDGGLFATRLAELLSDVRLLVM